MKSNKVIFIFFCSSDLCCKEYYVEGFFRAENSYLTLKNNIYSKKKIYNCTTKFNITSVSLLFTTQLYWPQKLRLLLETIYLLDTLAICFPFTVSRSYSG